MKLSVAPCVAFCSSLAVFCLLFSACENSEKTLAASYQSEARSNLRAIYVLQETCYSERSTYCGTFELLNFNPPGMNRYAYFLPGDRIPAEKGGPYQLPDTVKPRVNEKGYQVVAVGNIDSDPGLDVWTVDETESLQNVINDVEK